MGCVSSKAFESESAPVTANPTAQFLNRNVGRESNRNLMEKRSKSEKSNYQREVKLLLLGTGESGKVRSKLFSIKTRLIKLDRVLYSSK